LVLPLALAAVAVAVTASSAGGAPGDSCRRPVSGGTASERAAIERILCRLPGTAIRGVALRDHAPQAPPAALWLAFTLAYPTTPRAVTLAYTRARWEADIAAAAVRDVFSQFGLAHVVAYEALSVGAQPDPVQLFGIARPEWGVPRWSAEPGSAATLGLGVPSWTQLQASLAALARRFGMRTRLERYEPLGRAPVVTVTTDLPGPFIDAGGLRSARSSFTPPATTASCSSS
jgi:hypothetical protein